MSACLVVHLTMLNHWQVWLNDFLCCFFRYRMGDHIEKVIINARCLPSERDNLTAVLSPWIQSHADRVFFEINFVAFSDDDPTEYISLRSVYDQVASASYSYVGYIHSKGVTYPASRDVGTYSRVRQWSSGMLEIMFEAVPRVFSSYSEQHAKCFGINFESKPNPHFSGNFFWVRGDSKLTPPVSPAQIPREAVDPKGRWRLYYEFWICSCLCPENIFEIGRTYPPGLLGFHYRNFPPVGFPRVYSAPRLAR